MKLYQDELVQAQTYTQAVYFEGLTSLQIRNIRERGRTLYCWFRQPPRLHTFINLAAIAFVLFADAATLL